MNKIMKLLLLVLLLFSISSTGMTAGGGNGNLDKHFGKVTINLKNKPSLQRGAKYFVNYCLSCHPAGHSRYKRVADDLGISEELTIKHLIFTGQKFGDLMTVSMSREDAQAWFLGIEPPDLSTHVRAITPQSVYEFLMSFYIDESRPFGVNNLLKQNTAMPHVLVGMQGLQKAVYHKEINDHGDEKKVFDKFETIQPGTISDEEYKQVVTDIVNFLAYISEPAQLVRKKIGVGVLLFLALLGTVSYFLKRNYWKDVH